MSRSHCDTRRGPGKQHADRIYRDTLRQQRQLRGGEAAATSAVGEVVLLDIAFADSSGSKLRPTVVLEVRDESIVVVPLRTIKPGRHPNGFQLENWEAAGLSRPSATMAPVEVAPGRVLAAVGRVSERDWRGIVREVVSAPGTQVTSTHYPPEAICA